MSYQPHRAGVHATINGATYPARYHSAARTVAISSPDPVNPDPAVFDWDETRSLWFAELAVADCAAVVEVVPRARHLDRECYVDVLDESGRAEIVYADQDTDGRHTVPAADLVDYREDRYDLSAAVWEPGEAG